MMTPDDSQSPMPMEHPLPGEPTDLPTDQRPADDLLALRPRSFGELLRAAWELYRRYARTFLLTSAAVMGPLALVQVAMIAVSSDPHHPVRSLLTLPLLVVVCVLSLLVQGAMVKVVSDAYLNNPVEAGSAYRHVWRHAGAFIGTQLLYGLMVCGPAVLMGLGIVLGVGGLAFGVGGLSEHASATGVGASAACLLGGGLLGLVGLVLTVYLTFVGMFISEAVLIEGLSGMDAFRRSRELMRGNFATVFVIGLLYGAVSQLLVAPVVYPATFAAIALGEHGWMLQCLGQLWQSVVTLVVLPALWSVYILLYYDTRIRREGFDLDRLASSLVAFGFPQV